MKWMLDKICLISFFSLYELFTAFTWGNDTRSLVNSLFEVKIFNPFPSFTSSPSSSGMGSKSTNSFGVVSTNSSFLSSFLYQP